MADTLTITLANNQYTLPRLTLGQLRDLSIGVVMPDSPDPQETVRRSFDRSVSIIVTALSVSTPDMTHDALYAMSISRQEMVAASDAILKFSGLITAVGDTETGEDQAGTASTGNS